MNLQPEPTIPDPTPAPFEDFTVTQLSPLLIQRDEETQELAADTMVNTDFLIVGDRVRVELAGTRLIVHGRADGTTLDGTLVPITTADHTTVPHRAGLQVWDSTLGALYVSNGSTWELIDTRDTGPLTSAVWSAASGWSLDSQTTRKVGLTVTTDVRVTRSGGTITVPADGDITNSTVANLDSAYWPSDYVGFTPVARIAAIILDYTNGHLDLSAVLPGSTIVNGSVFRLTATWLAAT